MILVSGILAVWGLFHQFIVGAAITLFAKEKEMQLRLVILGWVAYGAFISFAGILSIVLISMFGLNSKETRVALYLITGGMTIFTGHTFISGVKKFPRPIKISFAIEVIYIITCAVSLIAFGFKES